MKPVCVPCQRFYRMKRSGYYFIEGMPRPHLPGTRAIPGTSNPDGWTPYKVWCGDLWECQGCGAQIISGVGNGPVSEHYQDDFKEHVRKLNADQLQVNDC